MHLRWPLQCTNFNQLCYQLIKTLDPCNFDAQLVWAIWDYLVESCQGNIPNKSFWHFIKDNKARLNCIIDLINEDSCKAIADFINQLKQRQGLWNLSLLPVKNAECLCGLGSLINLCCTNACIIAWFAQAEMKISSFGHLMTDLLAATISNNREPAQMNILLKNLCDFAQKSDNNKYQEFKDVLQWFVDKLSASVRVNKDMLILVQLLDWTHVSAVSIPNQSSWPCISVDTFQGNAAKVKVFVCGDIDKIVDVDLVSAWSSTIHENKVLQAIKAAVPEMKSESGCKSFWSITIDANATYVIATEQQNYVCQSQRSLFALQATHDGLEFKMKYKAANGITKKMLDDFLTLNFALDAPRIQYRTLDNQVPLQFPINKGEKKHVGVQWSHPEAHHWPGYWSGTVSGASPINTFISSPVSSISSLYHTILCHRLYLTAVDARNVNNHRYRLCNQVACFGNHFFNVKYPKNLNYYSVADDDVIYKNQIGSQESNLPALLAFGAFHCYKYQIDWDSKEDNVCLPDSNAPKKVKLQQIHVPPLPGASIDTTTVNGTTIVNDANTNGTIVNGTTAVNGTIVNGTTTNDSIVNGATVNDTIANGITTNGTTTNDTTTNGTKINGANMNDTTPNGTTTVNKASIKGTIINGATVNGTNGTVINSATVNEASINGTIINGTTANGTNGTIINDTTVNGTTVHDTNHPIDNATTISNATDRNIKPVVTGQQFFDLNVVLPNNTNWPDNLTGTMLKYLMDSVFPIFEPFRFDISLFINMSMSLLAVLGQKIMRNRNFESSSIANTEWLKACNDSTLHCMLSLISAKVLRHTKKDQNLQWHNLCLEIIEEIHFGF